MTLTRIQSNEIVLLMAFYVKVVQSADISIGFSRAIFISSKKFISMNVSEEVKLTPTMLTYDSLQKIYNYVTLNFSKIQFPTDRKIDIVDENDFDEA